MTEWPRQLSAGFLITLWTASTHLTATLTERVHDALNPDRQSSAGCPEVSAFPTCHPKINLSGFHIPSWLQTLYVAKKDPELPILLSPSSESWDCRPVPPSMHAGQALYQLSHMPPPPDYSTSTVSQERSCGSGIPSPHREQGSHNIWKSFSLNVLSELHLP